MMHQTHTTTTTVVMVLSAGVAVMTAAPTTFLSVAKDMAPPSSATTNTTSSAANIAECGQLCFAAGVERCLAFVWRPGGSPQVLVTPSNKSSSNLRRSVRGEGRCELLPCLPHPTSLTPLPGAHLFVVKSRDSTVPPSPFTPNLVPSSYSMACTFAYRVFAAPQLGYWQAQRRCSQDGARLVVFKSRKEEESVSVAVKPTEPYWIGLTDRQTEGEWRWGDGSKLRYSNWDSGQPNNFLRGNKDQDCVMLYNGYWNDHQCQDALRFICQVPLLHR